VAEITATNPNTGERVILRNGAWIPIGNINTQGKLQTFGRNLVGSMFEGSQNLVEQGVNASINAVNDVIQDTTDYFGAPRSESQRGWMPQLPNLPNAPQRAGPPQIPNVTLPRSSRDDLFAAAQMAGEGAAALATGDFSQFSQNPVQQQQQISQAGREQNPISVEAGNLFGPALMVSAARSPAAATNAIREIARQTLAARNGFGFMRGAAAGPSSGGAVSLARTVDNAFSTSKTAQWVATRFPRLVGAGLEGATIAMIDNGDPLEVAAWAAGTQAAGSVSLTALSGLSGGGNIASKGLRIAGGAAGMAMFLEIAKSLTPGGEERDFARMFESMGTTTAKVAGFFAVGAFAGIAGLGRTPSRSTSMMNMAASFSDAITALPRNAVFSVINNAVKDDRIEPVLNKLASDPGYFGPEAARKIERAFTSGAASLTTILDDLSQNIKFQERLNAL